MPKNRKKKKNLLAQLYNRKQDFTITNATEDN